VTGPIDRRPPALHAPETGFAGLTTAQAEAFYDRHGARQDHQGYYATVALTELILHTAFEQAQAVVEVGCGTGQFAEQLLANHLPPAATYWGGDLSAIMLRLTRQRLARFGTRVTTWKATGGAMLPLGEASADRFVSNYVLDLLAPEAIGRVVAEAHRILAPGGRLGLVSLTPGEQPLTKLVTALWKLRFALRPALVGGCRPVELRPYLAPAAWKISHRRVVVGRGISSEVVVAVKR